MYVPRGKDKGSLSFFLRMHKRKIEHSANRLRRALGRIERFSASKQVLCILLALTNYPVCLVKGVSAEYLGQVVWLGARQRLALMPGHMKAQAA